MNDVETITEYLEILRRHKNQGHSRKSPGSLSEQKAVQQSYTCKVCKKTFESSEALQTHMHTHIIKCDKCPFRTESNQQLVNHMNFNHKEATQLECSFCKSLFNSSNALETHMTIHSFNCEKCSLKTDSHQQLVNHININHKEATPIRCSFCPATFMEKKNIFAHRKQYHFSFKACLNKNNCSFKDLCSFNHNPITEGALIC